MGFAVGNERLIGALARVKSYLDYGAFTPIQVAATAALKGDQSCVDDMRALYKKRRDCLVDSFARVGWDIPSPPATMFAWVPIPESCKEMGSLEFSKLLLEKADVAVALVLVLENMEKALFALHLWKMNKEFAKLPEM